MRRVRGCRWAFASYSIATVLAVCAPHWFALHLTPSCSCLHLGYLPACSVMPQDHFNYAATWWTLSAASLALAVKAVRQGMRPR